MNARIQDNLPTASERRRALSKQELDTVGISLMTAVQQSFLKEMWGEILPGQREQLVASWLRIVRGEFNIAIRASKADRVGYETRITARLIEDIQGRGGFGMLWIGALPQERVTLRSAWERALKQALDPIFARAYIYPKSKKEADNVLA